MSFILLLLFIFWYDDFYMRFPRITSFCFLPNQTFKNYIFNKPTKYVNRVSYAPIHPFRLIFQEPSLRLNALFTHKHYETTIFLEPASTLLQTTRKTLKWPMNVEEEAESLFRCDNLYSDTLHGVRRSSPNHDCCYCCTCCCA